MKSARWNEDNIPDQSGRRIIITGATSGIGEEAARVLAGKNAAVIIAVRDIPKAETVITRIRSEFPHADISARHLDLTALDSVKTFADSIVADFSRLDVLINNAGIMMCPFSKTSDGFEIQMGTNHLGHFALTGRLLPLLRQTPQSRIVIVSSIAHKMGRIKFSDLNWETRKYDTSRAYADSKLANLYFAWELERKLSAGDAGGEPGEAACPMVTAAHPGVTATELQRHSGLLSFLNKPLAQGVKMGALPTLRAGFDEAVKPGDFYGPSGFLELHGGPVKVTSSKRSRDEAAGRKFWILSEGLTGFVY